MLPPAATEFYAVQQRVNAATVREVRRAWRRMGDDFDGSWRRHSPTILAALVEAQQQMTEKAAAYVPRVLKQTGIPDRPVADFRPESLVGMASDGRRLDTLAYGAVTETKTAVGNGADPQQALAAGGNWLDLMTKLQVADAARQAVGVMFTSRKNLGGYVRVLNPPSCQRCAILAGRFYRWSSGFQRHPRCDCVNMPSQNAGWAESEGFITDPMGAYKQGHIRDLTEAQKFMIDNGADIGKVVNATRGMSTTATRRAIKFPRGTVAPAAPGTLDLLAPLRRAQQAQGTLPAAEGLLTPEGIYQQAGGDRDKAIALLRQWGYLT
jgi:hypothetical protein